MLSFSRKKRYLFSFVGGLLMALSFPFTGGLSLLMLIAWIPLLLVENNISHNNYRSSKVFIHSYFTFLVYNTGTTWWIWNASPGGAVFAILLNSLLMASVFQLFHFTKKHAGKKEGYLALIFYWIGFEYLHYHWELSWPWLNLGNVFANHHYLIQWYSYSGVLGGTLWILICNLIGFRIVQNVYVKNEKWLIQRPLVWSLLILVFLPMGISLFQYYNYKETEKPIEVVVTQPNIDPYNEKFSGSIKDQLNKICDLADIHATEKTDFILAPETALPFSFYEDEIQRIIYYHYLVERKAKWGKSALFIGASTKKYFKKKNSRASRKIYGGPGYEEYYNSSMLIDQFDRPFFVHKSKLVLGVEKVPFSHIFPFLDELAIDNGGTSGTLGVEDESQVLKSTGTTFAPLVCYESIYGEFVSQQVRKGAEAIFIITNDGWWGDTPGYKQHLILGRLRAIENRRSIARSANTGTSCFINQRGDILQATDYWKEASIKANINKNSKKTVYTIYGDVIGRSFAFVSVLLILMTLAKIIRARIAHK
jgi:apolipoprotein N-acyltransferase